MTPEQFCYWLQGHFELAEGTTLSETQVLKIKNHLQLVFKKETPDRASQELPDGFNPLDILHESIHELTCGLPGQRPVDELRRVLDIRPPWPIRLP